MLVTNGGKPYFVVDLTHWWARRGGVEEKEVKTGRTKGKTKGVFDRKRIPPPKTKNASSTVPAANSTRPPPQHMHILEPPT